MRFKLSCYSLLTFISAFSQTIHLETERFVEDDAFRKSQSILPIYQYTSKLIEEYESFGIATDEPLDFYEIRHLPDMNKCSDTGYTYIYFSGADNEFRQGYLLTLVGNFKRTTKTIYFFIDRNNDLDFTNDGPPDSITRYDHDKIITLHNRTAPNATYSIKLSRFRYGENTNYKSLLTQHYKKNSGTKIFTDINYCFREQRYNSVLAHYRTETDSFTIGLKDMNVNGLYDEACTDMWYVGRYRSTINLDDLTDLTPTINRNAFEWNGKKYRFERIESTAAFIEIREDKNARLSNKLEIGKKVPDFTYYNIFNLEHSLKELRKYEVYIFFWDKETLTWDDTTYLGKLHREFPDQLKVLTLNHGDDPRIVRIAFYYDTLSFPIGYSNADIARSFFLEDVPRGYYLGKHRRLKNDKIMPKEMYEFYLSKTRNGT